MNTIKQFFWLSCTAILFAGSLWHYYQQSPTVRLDAEALAHSVQTTVRDLKIQQYNTEGQLTNFFSSPWVEHIPHDDVYLFQQPRILVSQEQQPPWDIRANQGKAIANWKKIIFSGQVVVEQAQGKKNLPSIFKTEEVTYYPKEKKASTDLLVTYEQPGNKIESQGMNAYLEEKRVELLHRARGHYAPTKG